MSGVVGLWNLDGGPADPGVLSLMSAALRHRGLDGEGHVVAGAVGFACQHLWVTPEEVGEVQPLVGRSGAMLVMDGRLDNRDELLGALELPGSVSDASCALAAFEAWGERFAERLSGDFALAILEPGQEPRLLLVRDPMGIRPLYYHRGDGFFAFGSEIKALLAHPDVPLRPDDDGLADFLMYSSRPLDRQEVTCFAGISALPASHTAVVTRERVTIRRYWDFDAGRTLRLGSFEEYAEAFREQFAQAVRRRSRSARPVAVSVSGGLDSSSIFCQGEVLRRSGAATCPGLFGVSYFGPEGTPADERQYLEAIEAAYGVTIDRIPIAPLLGVVQGAERQVWHIEAPFLDYLWGVTRELHRTVQARGARVLLSGHWGDQVLFSTAYLVDLARRFAWGKVWRHLREYDRWFAAGETRELRRRLAGDLLRRHVPGFLVPPLKWMRRRLTRPVRARPWFSDGFLARGLRFANRPATLGDGFHSTHARSIYLEARSKYHVHCMEWHNKIGALHGLDLAFPFLDRDLIALLMAVPGEMQNRGGVPRALLRAAMPGILPEPVLMRSWKADFSEVVNVGVERDFAYIARHLGGESLGVRLGYLSSDRLAAELARAGSSLQGPDCVRSWELTDLFGLEVWLRVFLNGRRPGKGSPSPLTEMVQ